MTMAQIPRKRGSEQAYNLAPYAEITLVYLNATLSGMDTIFGAVFGKEAAPGDEVPQMVMAVLEEFVESDSLVLVPTYEPGTAALFYQPPKKDAPIEPIAIQVTNVVGTKPDNMTEPVEVGPPVMVFPGDGDAWELAKRMSRGNSGGFHAIQHLIYNHQQQSVLATVAETTLAMSHPLRAVVDYSARESLALLGGSLLELFNPSGVVPNAFGIGFYGARQILDHIMSKYSWKNSGLEWNIKARGADKLQGYLYQDDMGRVMTSLEEFFRSYFQHFYDDNGAESKSDVKSDRELQVFASDVQKTISDFPQMGSIADVATLAAQMVWLGGAQHHVVNFQAHYNQGMIAGAMASFSKNFPEDNPVETVAREGQASYLAPLAHLMFANAVDLAGANNMFSKHMAGGLNSPAYDSKEYRNSGEYVYRQNLLQGLTSLANLGAAVDPRHGAMPLLDVLDKLGEMSEDVRARAATDMKHGLLPYFFTDPSVMPFYAFI
ncbi:hypothetical protein ACHAWF_007259 [Thalassiosira exigua]